MNKPIDWLSGPPWVRYRTLKDLLGRPEGSSEVQEARQAMLSHPQIQSRLQELVKWPGPILKSHKFEARTANPIRTPMQICFFSCRRSSSARILNALRSVGPHTCNAQMDAERPGRAATSNVAARLRNLESIAANSDKIRTLAKISPPHSRLRNDGVG